MQPHAVGPSIAPIARLPPSAVRVSPFVAWGCRRREKVQPWRTGKFARAVDLPTRAGRGALPIAAPPHVAACKAYSATSRP